MQLAGGHVQAFQDGDILDVLHELGLGAHRHRSFEAVDHGAAQERVVRAGVEAVHRIDHHRHPSEPRCHPSVDARLRIVGVDDIGTQPPEQANQLAESEDVIGDRD